MPSVDMWAGHPCVHEHRFLLARHRAYAFIEAVARHVSREIYDAERPMAFARTIYYDNDVRDYARTGGSDTVERLRVREYAAARPSDRPVLTGVCFLEYKCTRGNLRTKVRLPGDPADIAELIASAGRSVRPFGDHPALGELARRLRRGDLQPQVATYYRRESFVGKRAAVRITLDEGVRFLEPPAIGSVRDDLRAPELGRVGQRVLEVKYGSAPPRWLELAMRDLRESRTFSKYAGAMAALRRGVSGIGRTTRPLTIPAIDIVDGR